MVTFEKQRDAASVAPVEKGGGIRSPVSAKPLDPGSHTGFDDFWRPAAEYGERVSCLG